MYMNDMDMDRAVTRFIQASKPNRLGLALMVRNLAEWTNENSDGWAYWPKPGRAASKAIALIESRTWAENQKQEENDITDAEMLAAARPVKAFLTRQKVDPSTKERILRPVTD